MAIIKPFRAVRPAKNYVDMVAELPYDVMNREEAKKMGEENKYSFIHIDRAEVDLDDNVDEHDEAVYLKAKENLDKFKDEKILINFLISLSTFLVITSPLYSTKFLSPSSIILCVSKRLNTLIFITILLLYQK